MTIKRALIADHQLSLRAEGTRAVNPLGLIKKEHSTDTPIAASAKFIVELFSEQKQ